jgi:hypothetical protein
VIAHDTDNIGAGFAERVGAFAKSGAEQGGIVRGSSTDNAAVRSYCDPEGVKAGSLYPTDHPIQLFGSGQLPDRFSSPVYRVASTLLIESLPQLSAETLNSLTHLFESSRFNVMINQYAVVSLR